MKHTIEIDSRSKAGQGLLSIALELAKNHKDIIVGADEKADRRLLNKMLAGKPQGILNAEEKKEFLKQMKQLMAE